LFTRLARISTSCPCLGGGAVPIKAKTRISRCPTIVINHCGVSVVHSSHRVPIPLGQEFSPATPPTGVCEHSLKDLVAFRAAFKLALISRGPNFALTLRVGLGSGRRFALRMDLGIGVGEAVLASRYPALNMTIR
jgi:hypothetical protein